MERRLAKFTSGACLAVSTLLVGSQRAISDDWIHAVSHEVQELCAAPPAERSAHLRVEGEAGVSADVRVELMGLVGGKGSASLTQEEWEGVQRVLPEDQSKDNARYRQCVERLTPLFLQKLGPPPPPPTGPVSRGDAIRMTLHTPTGDRMQAFRVQGQQGDQFSAVNGSERGGLLMEGTLVASVLHFTTVEFGGNIRWLATQQNCEATATATGSRFSGQCKARNTTTAFDLELIKDSLSQR